MRTPLKYLRETHLIGRRCHEQPLDREYHPVLRNAPFMWVGYSVLRPPYHIVRLRSVHSHLIACVSGRGRTFVDGKVVDWAPGQVLLAPVGAHHAFEIAGRGPWQIAWVFFDDTEKSPVLPMKQAELIDADTGDFVSALRMLIREAAGAALPAMMESLVSVLNLSARRLAGTGTLDLRLSRMWEQVEADLARGWSVPDLARLACVSEEHLRRLCHRHHQRSPMDHLTHLRCRKAGWLLRFSPEKVENIAQHVGYGSVYSFSTAFRRWSGRPPARYRRADGR
ncbi:MAG TPA: AraC family transcriptional regulator [Candidatus Didemnitutus sp.]|nr:AraC family transcriptional regulator [Candidatus Didemnitutus sp.]